MQELSQRATLLVRAGLLTKDDSRWIPVGRSADTDTQIKRCQNGSTWIRFPSRRTSDVPTSLSCKSRVLTLATPVNSLSPGPGDNVYPGLGASDPLSVLIESKRDVGGIKLPIADPLPGAIRAGIQVLARSISRRTDDAYLRIGL